MTDFDKLERQDFSLRPRALFTKSFFKDLHDAVLRKETNLDDKEKEIVKNTKTILSIANNTTDNIQQACTNKDLEKITSIVINDLYETIEPVSNNIAQLMEHQLKVAAEINIVS